MKEEREAETPDVAVRSKPFGGLGGAWGAIEPAVEGVVVSGADLDAHLVSLTERAQNGGHA